MKIAILLSMLAVSGFGQAGPAPMPTRRPPSEFFAWWDTPIAKDLNLTDDQQKQIKTIVHDYRNKLIDLRGAVEKADGNLNDVLNEEKIDMKRATDAVDKMTTAKAELNRNLTLMSVSLRAVLTPVQWKELQKRQRPNGMMPRGNGMSGLTPFHPRMRAAQPGQPGQTGQPRPAQGPNPPPPPGPPPNN